MKLRALALIALTALFASGLHGQDTPDTSTHTVQFVTVDQDVKLEVLDWGGTGRPLVFLAGGGRTAHDYDEFAPKFTAKYHVYGITRRGFGASSKPAPTVANYAADRLGDDVLAVMNALQLNRPVLIGHSLAGEELSSIGSRYPEKVAGLIYLDAAYPWAFYDQAKGDSWLDMLAVKKDLDALAAGATYDRAFVQDLSASVSQLAKDMPGEAKRLASMPGGLPGAPPPISLAMLFGEQKYTKIPVPILAIFAVPHNLDDAPGDAATKATLKAADLAHTTALANTFEAGVPSAQVIRIANADHTIFRSNEAEVFRDIDVFLSKLD
jgi:pimeloyl-ACP methyl ester carboxylesterase